MNRSETTLPEVILVEPDVFGDDRGFFMELWNEQRYRDLGLDVPWVQDNLSYSQKGIVRGLHFQYPNPQGKLVSVLDGCVYDVAVDVRHGSPSFGRWVSAEISSENRRQLYVPPGFAHGFAVLSEHALFHYKCTDFYVPAAEGAVRWNDPALAIPWPIADAVLSKKDAEAPLLRDIDPSRLPRY